MGLTTNKKVETFFSSYRTQSFKKGDQIIKPEKAVPGVFYLIDGVVRMYTVSKEGEEMTINTFKPSSFFPVGWAINDSPNRYIYEGETDGSISIAPKDQLVYFLKSEPDVLFDLLTRIYRGLDGYFMRMESLLGGDAYVRTATQLLIHAKRFGAESGNGNSYHLKLTHHDIASLSGLSRETVTREIKKMSGKGIISYSGQDFHIHNLEQLENECK